MVYVVRRNVDRVDYDEYDAFVVIAGSPEEALNMCINENHYFTEHDVTVEEVSQDFTPRIILGSFNAG